MSHITAAGGRWHSALCVALLALLAFAAACTGGATTAPGSGAPAASPGAQPGAASPAPPLEKITVGHAFITVETLPIWIALEQGLYRQYGLDATPASFQTSAQLAPAMSSGEVQIGLTTGSGVTEFNLAGGDQVIVAGYSNAMRYFLYARDPAIQRLEDLRGKRVGITRRGGGIDHAAHIFTERAGLTYGRDVPIIELGTAQNQVGAIAAGAVDAVVVAVPTNLQVEREGARLLTDTKQLGVPYVPNAIAVERQYLQTHRDTVRRFLQAHIAAVETIKRDRALAKRVLAANLKTDDDELLTRSLELFIDDLQDVPYPSERGLLTVIEFAEQEARRQGHPPTRTLQPADYVDDSLVRELDHSGFIRQLRGG
ncbi:MAG TPA: ABC transporter substrate-binding protein [Chloroflexota bacterium]|nr:ABC transporter substrate-binding protein [Chloroflexota bacterium]